MNQKPPKGGFWFGVPQQEYLMIAILSGPSLFEADVATSSGAMSNLLSTRR